MTLVGAHLTWMKRKQTPARLGPGGLPGEPAESRQAAQPIRLGRGREPGPAGGRSGGGGHHPGAEGSNYITNKPGLKL